MNAGRVLTAMQDFIGGRLSDDEHRAFEDRLLRDPTLVRELERSLRMREGLQQLRNKGYFKKAADEKAASGGWSFRVWVPALAAAACAGFALFLWLSHVAAPAAILSASPASQVAGNVTPVVAAHFTFVSVRGGSRPDLDLPSAGLIEIRAQPSTHLRLHRYRVTLVRDDGNSAKRIAALAGLALSADGYLRCYADASRLTQGSYLLRIQADTDATGMEEVFPFNLRARVSGSSR
jgi:hypothetical protein